MSTDTPGATVLIAEDEEPIRNLLAAALRHAGFDVTTASRGDEALTIARRLQPDIYLLDVMMPGLDGFDLVERLRREGLHAPALFLSARDSVSDRIQGLRAGGDDYVTKPFSLDEVIVRVEALLRRAVIGAREPAHLLRMGDLELDVDRHEVRKAGATVDLSPTEFNLLRLFLNNPDRVLSKQVIRDRVWDVDFDGDPTIVETYVSYLRKKVDHTEPRMIRTVRGFGYTLSTPKEPE